MSNSQEGSIYFLFSPSESLVVAEFKQEKKNRSWCLFHKANATIGVIHLHNAARIAVVRY